MPKKQTFSEVFRRYKIETLVPLSFDIVGSCINFTSASIATTIDFMQFTIADFTVKLNGRLNKKC